jgi:hypothetical protein
MTRIIWWQNWFQTKLNGIKTKWEYHRIYDTSWNTYSMTGFLIKRQNRTLLFSSFFLSVSLTLTTQQNQPITQQVQQNGNFIHFKYTTNTKEWVSHWVSSFGTQHPSVSLSPLSYLFIYLFCIHICHIVSTFNQNAAYIFSIIVKYLITHCVATWETYIDLQLIS